MEQNTSKVNPMCITLENGETYTLEFSRETVKFAEDRKFNISELTDYPQTNIPALWFYAFRMHHKEMARSQTDKILREEMGGLTPEEIERLVQLYNQPTESLILSDGARKNARVTVSL